MHTTELERRDVMKTCLSATIHAHSAWMELVELLLMDLLRKDVTSTESDSFFLRFKPISFKTFHTKHKLYN